MLGITGKPESKDGNTLEPMMSYHLQAMSIGFLIDEETPMIWRGPMVTQALEQLLNDTNWDELDYLVIDLPPGTGDTQLTLAQKVPVSGAIIVTTEKPSYERNATAFLSMAEDSTYLAKGSIGGGLGDVILTNERAWQTREGEIEDGLDAVWDALEVELDDTVTQDLRVADGELLGYPWYRITVLYYE